MPKRIGFHVIYATSEVAQHPASELGWAGPASRGWRSAPGARPPHDLVLQLECRAAITRVQLLAHHHLIPQRIELLVHDSASTDGVPRTPSSPQYEAVGWVALAPGAGGDSTARELRTAAVPHRPARYLRLRLGEPHQHDVDAAHQVALMGVNIFGIEIDADESKEGACVESSNKVDLQDNEQYSPYDDLAFIMYVDNDVADIIRQLEAKKKIAIKEERFEYARKLKAACSILGAGGRVLGGLQLQKRLAAAAEQYERATRRRDAIAAGRARLAAAVNLPVLLEPDGLNPQNDEYSADEAPFSIETLTQRTSHRSFDAPSPPTVVQPLSSKDSATTCADLDHSEADSGYQLTPRPNECRSLAFSTNPPNTASNTDENQPFYANGVEEHVPQRKYSHVEFQSDEQKHDSKICNEMGTDGTVSPYENEPIYADSSHFKGNVSFNQSESMQHRINFHSNINSASAENLCDSTGKIYFEDQVSHNSRVDVHNGDVEYAISKGQVSKEKADYMMGNINGRLPTGGCEGSYFNSPANSVSPTNLHYNSEGCGNGAASPATSSRSSGQHLVTSSPGAAAAVVVKRRNRSAGPGPPAHHRSSYEAYEERLVPALRHSHTNEFLRGCQMDQAETHVRRSKMPERERKQAALPILIYGEELVEKIYSKHFVEKEEGLQNLKTELRSFDSKVPGGAGVPAALSPNKAARAAALLLHRALRDPVFSVYSLAAELTRVFFTEFVSGRVNSAEVARSVERLVPELLTRAGDPAPRVHSLAMHTLLTMADCPPVRSLNIIPAYLVRPLTAGTAPRLALSRLLMVEQLLLNHGIDKNSGLKTRAVAELGAGGLTHGQGAVRRAAERLLLAAYARAPRLVRAQLPPDDPVTRRNLLYRHLFEGFDRVDKRKQEEVLGTNQCEDIQPSRTAQFLNEQINPKMVESMTMSQMSTSQMSMSQMSNSMASSMGSSMSGSLCQPKSSMKRQTSKKYTTNVGFNGVKTDVESPGYNKLRLDSAVSPKHQRKANKSAQNPRNYVLEKNWQNSVMQNGNHCPQIEGSCKSVEEIREINQIYIDFQKNRADEKTSNSSKSCNSFSASLNNCNGKQSINSSTTSLSNGPLHPYHKSGVVARNLQSSIVFDNRTSYSDGENVPYVENEVKKVDKTTENVDSSKSEEKIPSSPVGSLKRNKNIKNVIYRSKSGSNVPTCFENDNFDSFDESQVDLENYEYCQHEAEARALDNCDRNSRNMNYHSDTSSPEVCNNVEGGEELGQCPFCLVLVAEGLLDAHYWRECPLLGRCPACRAPFELRGLSQHLTDDCEKSQNFRRCSRCTEAVPAETYPRHRADNNCLETTKDSWKCPLCHLNVAADEDSWRQHLADSNEESHCTANPRMVTA